MLYATKEDLAVWLGYLDANGDPDVSQLPGDADRLIRNASKLIDYSTLGQINTTNEKHLETAKNATTAQCEYWIDGIGESADIHPAISGYSVQSFSVQFKNGSMPKLSSRARRELWLGGLLNRTVGRI